MLPPDMDGDVMYDVNIERTRSDSVIGNEAKVLLWGRLVQKTPVDFTAKIPMKGGIIDSLNASVAERAVLAHLKIVRQRVYARV